MVNAFIFRKVAAALWRDAGDPSVYGFVELDVTEFKGTTKVLPKIVLALSQTMSLNPELTSMMRWGRSVQRKDKIISVMVNIPKSKKNDLSLLNIDTAKPLRESDISSWIEGKAKLVRKEKDPHLGAIRKIIRYLPQWLVRPLLAIYAFFIYELGTRLGLRFLPLRPFGSVIVSNVGSLGIKKALLPLVPLARASVLLSVGKVVQEPRVHQGEICIRDIVHVGVTFDHRLFDGSHAAKMLVDFEKAFYEQ